MRLACHRSIGRGFCPRSTFAAAVVPPIITLRLLAVALRWRPGILNRSISLDGEPWTIVGVLPKIRAAAPAEAGRLVRLDAEGHSGTREAHPGSAWWNVVARLTPGVTLRAGAGRDGYDFSRARQGVSADERDDSAVIVPLREHLMGGVRLPLVLMLGGGRAGARHRLRERRQPAAGARHGTRARVRHPFCARRRAGRLVRQLVAESLLLSAIAAGVGVALAHWTIRGDRGARAGRPAAAAGGGDRRPHAGCLPRR